MADPMPRSPCAACLARGKTWNGDDPQCAFLSGVFDTENWNCATMNALRVLAEENGDHKREWDSSFGVVHVDEGSFIVMTWYKERGRTARAYVMRDDEEPVVLDIETAQRALVKGPVPEAIL